MGEFTPGPWEAHPNSGCVTAGPDRDIVIAQKIAPEDTPLIGAAPNLYQGLETARAIIARYGGHGPELRTIDEILFRASGGYHE